MKNLMKLLFLAAFLNAILWIVLIPVWQYPDEQAHFGQVQHLAEFGFTRLHNINTSKEVDLSETVLSTKRDGLGNNEFTYHPEYKIDYTAGIYGPQERTITNLPIEARRSYASTEATRNPPLYYILGAVFYKAFYEGDLFTRVLAVRLLSVFLYLLIILTSYKLSTIIFDSKHYLSLFIPAAVAFMPMFVFASTGILPDPLTNLLFSAILFVCTKIIAAGVTKKALLLLTVLVILGIYTRQHFFLAIPIVLTAIFISNYKSRKNTAKIFFIALLLTGAIFFFDRFTTTIPIISNIRIPDSVNFKPEALVSRDLPVYLLETIKRTYQEVLPWYWGVYRWLSLTLPPLSYQIINRLLIIAVVGLLIKIVKTVRLKRFEKEDKILIFLALASIEYFLILNLWNYFFTLKNGYSFGVQGRYFFPLFVANITLILFGMVEIGKLFKSYSKYLLFTLTVLIVFFNDFTISYVASSYYDVSSLQTFINQASQYKPEIVKGNIILVIVVACIISQALFLTQYLRYIKRYESIK